MTAHHKGLSRRALLLSAGVSAGALLIDPFGEALAKPHQRSDQLLEYDALGLAELIKTRQISRTELVEIVIGRIDAMNPSLNFMTGKAFDRARERAGSSAFAADSRLAGVPILMKDLISIKGLPLTQGSKLFADYYPDKNVEYVNALEASGLNIIGQTNVPEMASFIMTSNALFGTTHNPWDMDYSVFSSSGGSACAVAAGVVPMAHGTDGAGSNRLPASATGTFGMKASRYRQLSGEADGSHDIAKTNQMISRTVRDSAAALDATEDKSGAHYKSIGFVTSPSVRRLKIGFVTSRDDDLLPVEPEVRDAQIQTAQLLEDMGHQVREIAWPVDDHAMAENYLKFNASKTAPLVDIIRRKFGDKDLLELQLLTPLLASSLQSYSKYKAVDIAQGIINLNGLVSVFDAAFARVDVMLTPVSPVVCPRLNEHSYNDLWDEEIKNFILARLKFTSPTNFGGVPAMSVPLGRSASGLPIGSHLIAARGNDQMLYELAYELEEASPWKNVWPPNSLHYSMK